MTATPADRTRTKSPINNLLIVACVACTAGAFALLAVTAVMLLAGFTVPTFFGQAIPGALVINAVLLLTIDWSPPKNTGDRSGARP